MPAARPDATRPGLEASFRTAALPSGTHAILVGAADAGHRDEAAPVIHEDAACCRTQPMPAFHGP